MSRLPNTFAPTAASAIQPLAFCHRCKNYCGSGCARRNLLSAPPAWLGYDIPNWSGDAAFEDIVADCYIFAVASRIEGLHNQLRVRASIDGLITRNVDNFLSERQSRRDPIGYAVFGNLEMAVADLTASGQAFVDELEDHRLKSASVIRLESGPTTALLCDPARLHEAVADASGWSEALAGLISTSDEGRTWMSDFLRSLRVREIRCFRVTDIVSAVAGRARKEWSLQHATPSKELVRQGDDDVRRLVRLVWPEETPRPRICWKCSSERSRSGSGKSVSCGFATG